MAHDGQDIALGQTALLPDLLELTGAVVAPAAALLETATARVRALVSVDGKVSNALVESNQTATHGLAWLATYVESLRQMDKWARALATDGKLGELEQLLLQIGFGEYLAQLRGGIQMNQGEILRPQDLGLGDSDMAPFVTGPAAVLALQGNTQAARTRLVELMQEQAGATLFGASGLDEELEMIRDQFRRYAVERVEPYAHEWHLKDELIPMEIIEELAEMGVFGLTIPEEFGGFGLSKA
ncbi:MAG: acyl-CoA dehydrogenase family protein, partial [Lutimaribacter sp.]